MSGYYGQYAPELLDNNYAREIWALYEEGKLEPDTQLTGLFEESAEEADVDSVLEEIKAVLAEEQNRQARMNDSDDRLK